MEEAIGKIKAPKIPKSIDLVTSIKNSIENSQNKSEAIPDDDSQTMDTETEPEDASVSHIIIKSAVKQVFEHPLKSLLPIKTRNTPRLTLVLDLDETLVHSEIKPINTANFIINITYEARPCSIYVNFRPGLFNFLETVSKHFELVLFTASHKLYAEQVMKLIDPKMKYIKHRLYRDSCLEYNGNYIKDLRILGRNLKETIILDNSIQAFALQPDNGIPIISWFNDQMDQELFKTSQFLEHIKNVIDVRTVLSEAFKLSNLNLVN